MISYVLGHKISIYEKSISTLLSHDGSRIRRESMVEKESNVSEITKLIFVSGKNSRKVKNFHPKLKVWARIILGCVHHRKSTNSSYYINDDIRHLLYFY